jgi:2-isopropylmalate synthase
MPQTPVSIFDTTLRDGEQSPGCSMNLTEKVRMANKLQALGVDIIEAGFPIASEGDFAAVKAIAAQCQHVKVAALCRTAEQDVARAAEALKYAARPRIHTFCATSDIHLEHKLKKTRAEVIDMTRAAVRLARSYAGDVEFSAEDATRSDIDYLCEVLDAAVDAGASVLNVPDTVGYTTPSEYTRLVQQVRERVVRDRDVIISVHCHNDLGLAVANSLAAVEAGARQVECTINGIGERAGNASLEEIVMLLHTRESSLGLWTEINTNEIARTSRLVSRLTGYQVQPNKAIVGRNAFAHARGVHQDGVLKDRATYEIIDPTTIGIEPNSTSK